MDAYVCNSDLLTKGFMQTADTNRPQHTGKHATSRDVAAMAGVSQSAVSRCFTPGASIAKETRDKVLQVAAALDYRPNVYARNLITGRTRIVGVVLAHLDNLFYPRFLQLLTERLQSMGMQVLLFVADGNRQVDLMAQLLNYRVDGIVLAATTLHSDLAKACNHAGIPVVLFNRVPSHALDRAFHSVQTDQSAGMAELTRLLIKRGHSRIAFLSGHLESSTNQARELGCRATLEKAGLPLFAFGVGNYDEVQAASVVMGWFHGGNRLRQLADCPDAIVAADDRMAMAAMDTLRHKLGLRVPDQVSVVGFDDVPQASWPAYDLTTYAQPLPQMIEAVVRLLSAQLQARDANQDPSTEGQSVVLKGSLCLRGSVRARTGHDALPTRTRKGA
jgi:DNA-binding LacI/PurR family transcriptional regulator